MGTPKKRGDALAVTLCFHGSARQKPKTCNLHSEARSPKSVHLAVLLAAGLGALACGQQAGAADAAPGATASAPAQACDPYKNYECLDKYLGEGFGERFVNYQKLEWGQPAGPADPKAPSPRREDWPATPMTTPPMPFTEWPYGGTESLGVTRTGSIDSPLMVAVSNTALGQWMNDNGFQVYGWIDVGTNVSSSTTKPGGNWPAAYLYNPDEITLDQAVIYWDRFPDTVQKDHIDWGMRISAIYGTNYRYTTSYGLASYQLLHDNKANGYDFPMLWGELFFPQFGEGLMVRLGRFISLPDIEAQLAPNNYMYTHSMTYTYDNYTNTGLQTTYAVNKQFFVQAGLTVGTEASIPHLKATISNPHPNLLYPDATFKQDPGSMPSFTLCGRYTTMSGYDDVNVCADAINKGTWGYNNLQWFGATYYHKFNEQWHVAWEGYHIYIKGVPNLNNAYVQNLNALYGTDGGTPFSSAQGILFNNPNEAYCTNSNALTCRAGSYATVAYFNYSPNPMDNFSIRPEWFWDAEGQRTGTKTRYTNLGLGWQHWFSPQVEVRPEIAYYHSWNAPAFNGNFNALPTPIAPNKNNETILSGDIIWHF